MKCNVSAQSHVGLRRPNNEDMILIGNRFLRDETYEIQLQIDEHSGNMLFALADGMGGHKGGEVASEEVLKHLSVFFDSLPSGLSPEELRQTLSTWGREVHAHLKEMGTAPELFEMGTTLVGFLIYERKAFWFSCGDSRVYMMRGGELTQLSNDHTYDRYTGKKEHAHILVNCLGCGDSMYFDFQELTDTPLVGDTFLLCSDGLSDLVSNEQLTRFMRVGSTAPALVRMALSEGGRDNVSVCLINFVS